MSYKIEFGKKDTKKKYPKKNLSPLAKSLNAHGRLRITAEKKGNKKLSAYHEKIYGRQVAEGKILSKNRRKSYYDSIVNG
jgi:hypothetical protein